MHAIKPVKSAGRCQHWKFGLILPLDISQLTSQSINYIRVSSGLAQGHFGLVRFRGVESDCVQHDIVLIFKMQANSRHLYPRRTNRTRGLPEISL